MTILRNTVVMQRSRSRWATAIGLATVGFGLAVLVLTALTEVLRDRTLTLADGYWIGPLPWTALGVGLAIAGATVVVVSGSLSAWFQRGVIRRVVTVLAFAVAAFW